MQRHGNLVHENHLLKLMDVGAIDEPARFKNEVIVEVNHGSWPTSNGTPLSHSAPIRNEPCDWNPSPALGSADVPTFVLG